MPNERAKRNKPYALMAAFILLGILIVLLLGVWAVAEPFQQDHQLAQGLITQDTYESQVSLHSRVAEGLGAITPLAGGLALTATALIAIDNLRVAEGNRKIAEDRQATDLFVKAAEMLANKNLEVRLAGIYSLERIARDFPKDHWTVMEVLAAFIQKTSDGGAITKAIQASKERRLKKTDPPLISADLQVALGVIGRRDVTKDPRNERDLNLKLFGVNFSGVLFEEGADFRRTSLVWAALYKVSLIRAKFDNVTLSNADLRNSILKESSFIEANLRSADLREAYIQGAVFSEANLEGADLRGVKGREAAQIVAAKNWWLAKYDDEFAQELTEFAQKQAEHDPKLAEQLRLFEQHRHAQSEEPENPSDTPS